MPVLGSAAANPVVPPSWYNVKDYGAVGDNTTDDTVAIQAAVNALKASTLAATGQSSGQVLYFPRGFYKTTASLNFQGLAQVKILGADGKGGYKTPSSPGTVINYTAGGSATVVDARGSQGVVWDGVSIWQNGGATFTGVLLSLDSLVAGDQVGHRILNCQIRGLTGNTTAVGLSLAGNICTSVANVHFQDTIGTQVRMVNPSAPSTWSNANSFTSCLFSGNRVNSIRNPGPQTSVIDCTFEPTKDGSNNNIPAPILYDALGNEPAELLTVIGCGFWDNTGTAAGSAWIKATVATRVFYIAGTRFGLSPNGYGLSLSSHSGLVVNACRFGTEATGTSQAFDPSYTITSGVVQGSLGTNGATINTSVLI